MSRAGRFDIRVDQGSTYTLELQKLEDDEVTPIDLAGCSVHMQVRRSPADPEVLVEFGTEAPLEGIALVEAEGRITLLIEGATSAEWEFRSAVYDLEINYPAGAVERLVQGVFGVDPEVTK